MTTGTFYRYYPTKEALFEALVKPQADTVMGFFNEGLAAIRMLPPEEQTGAMSRVTGECIGKILDCVYDHYDRFKPLLCAAGWSCKGSRIASFQKRPAALAEYMERTEKRKD